MNIYAQIQFDPDLGLYDLPDVAYGIIDAWLF